MTAVDRVLLIVTCMGQLIGLALLFALLASRNEEDSQRQVQHDGTEPDWPLTAPFAETLPAEADARTHL